MTYNQISEQPLFVYSKPEKKIHFWADSGYAKIRFKIPNPSINLLSIFNTFFCWFLLQNLFTMIFGLLYYNNNPSKNHIHCSNKFREIDFPPLIEN